MNYIFLILIINILPSCLLIASYAVTEQEFFNIRAHAEKAWPDITDEEAFKEEFHDFLLKCPLPFCEVKDEDSFFCLLPKDSLYPIWFYKTPIFIDDNCIIIGNDNNSFRRIFRKGIVIRNSWMEKKGVTSTSEPQTFQLYYGLLKGLFLEKKEELFLQTVCTAIKETKQYPYSIQTVCVLKEKKDFVTTKRGNLHAKYSINIMYSIMATFLLHKLLEPIYSTNNNNLLQLLQQDNQINKPKSQVKQIDAENTHLKNNVDVKITDQNSSKNQSLQPVPNQNNDKKNRVASVYYVVPTGIVISALLILLYHNYFSKNRIYY